MYAQQGPVVMAPMNGAVMMPSYTVVSPNTEQGLHFC